MSSNGERPHPRAPAIGETQDGHLRRLRKPRRSRDNGWRQRRCAGGQPEALDFPAAARLAAGGFKRYGRARDPMSVSGNLTTSSGCRHTALQRGKDDIVNRPTRTRNGTIACHAPSHADVMSRRGRGQADCRRYVGT